MATGSPVSSCNAGAIPSWPSPAEATAVSRLWMSRLRCTAAEERASSVIARSRARFEARDSSAIARSRSALARSRACRRALTSATPACCTSTLSRNWWWDSGLVSRLTTRWPAMSFWLTSGYAHAQPAPSTFSGPPERSRAASWTCRTSADPHIVLQLVPAGEARRTDLDPRGPGQVSPRLPRWMCAPGPAWTAGGACERPRNRDERERRNMQ